MSSDFVRALRGEQFQPDNSMRAILMRGVDSFRRGAFAMGSASFQVYLQSKERKDDMCLYETLDCINRGDYCRAADVIAFGIVPLL